MRPWSSCDDPARDIVDESLVVRRGDQARPVDQALPEDREETLVPEPVLPERRLVEDERRAGPARARRRATGVAAPRRTAGTGCGPRIGPEGSPSRVHERRRPCRARAASRPRVTSSRHARREELPLRLLEDVGGAAGQLAGRQPGRVVADERDVPAVRSEQADEQPRERRLAAAVGPDQRDPFALGRIQRGVMQDRARPLVAVAQTPSPRAPWARPCRRGRQRWAADAGRPPPGSQMPASRIGRADRARTSAGGPTSIGRPSRPRARTTSASGQAIAARCSIRTIVVDRSSRRVGQPLGQRRGSGRIEVRRRLVEDEDARARGEHAGQRESLLLPARQGPRPALRSAASSPTAASASGTRRCIAVRRPAPVLEAERDVILDPLHDELGGRVLEHDPDPGRDGRSARGRRCDLPSSRSSPSTVAGISRGTSPAMARASVLLPDPDGPTTSSVCPGSSSNATSTTAGRSAAR